MALDKNSWDSPSLIEEANSKFKLSIYFKENKISFQETFRQNGWVWKRTCPFPDHKDDTPSFYFNQEEERFFCFGCNRGGQIVQFIAYIGNKKQDRVAKELLSGNYQKQEYIVYTFPDINKIQICLYEFAEKTNNWIQSHNDKVIEYNNLMLAFESYVKNHIKKIDIVELEARIKYCLNKLQEFSCQKK